MRKTPLIMLLAALCFFYGCSAGMLTSYQYDPIKGRRTKVVYSPLFSSDSMPLSQDAEFRVSLVITRRVEPISYGLLASVGGLGSDDTISSATVVYHFKNDSDQTLNVTLKNFSIYNDKQSLNVQQITLLSGDRFSTKPIITEVGTYNKELNLTLSYDLNGVEKSQDFHLIRQTMADLKK